MFEADVNRVGRSLQRLREVCRHRNWHVGIDRCDEAIGNLSLIIGHPLLSAEDQDQPVQARDDLRTLLPVLERFSQSQAVRRPPRLDDAQHERLAAMSQFFATMEGRLRRTLPEVPQNE